MACLQYKPSNITYKEKVYERDDILKLKQAMIQELDEVGFTNTTYLTMDMGSLVINVDNPSSSQQSANKQPRKLVTPSGMRGLSTRGSPEPPQSNSNVIGYMDLEVAAINNGNKGNI